MARVGRVDLNVLGTFAAVAEAGGFTAAAERLGMAKAQVSLDVARLERQLGTSLFTRTTRRVALTDAGRALYSRGIPHVRGIDEALLQVAAGSMELTGTLRLSASPDFITTSLSPATVEFARHHPKLGIDLRTSDRTPDLLKERVDVAICFGWQRDPALRSIKLSDYGQSVVASPAYLARCPTPRSPADLASHEWVALSLLPAPLTWTFRNAQGSVRVVRMTGRLKVDSISTLQALLEQGAGISIVDEISAGAALAAGRLVRVLPRWSLPRGGVHALCQPGQHVQAKVRAFVDFYRGYLRRERDRK